MKLCFKHLSIVFAFLWAFHAHGQLYPVHADVQITPPYSLYLSDYPVTGALKVNLRLLQSGRPTLAVGLRFKIEGVGITITSSPQGVYDPITIVSGQTTEVSGSDLATYLDPDNLIFNGYDKGHYLRTKKLPEGVYQITVDAVAFERYSSSLVVSNQATTTAWFVLNDPPRFNQPSAGDVVRATNPQIVTFQWLPQHLGSPNASQTTDYIFTMVEINPGVNEESRNTIDVQVANQAIQSQDPLYETTTTNTTLAFDNTMPGLLPGKFYAVRVQAVDRNGLDLFKNGGYSEVTWFRFGEVCLPPKNLKGQVPNYKKAQLQWESESNHSNFNILYKPMDGDDWYEQESMLPSTVLTDLRPATAYQYQVQAFCGSVTSDFSEVLYFNTPPVDVSAPATDCGATVSIDTVESTTRLAQAMVGDKFRVGAFDMYLTQVTGSAGTFSGKGEIIIPFLATKVKTEFSDISVNASGHVLAGQVKAQSTGLTLLKPGTLAMLTQAEAQALASQSLLCEDNLPPLEEDDPVLWVDEIPVLKGDTLIVDGKPIVVDDNTVLTPDNVVTIPKAVREGEDASNLIIDKDNGGKKYSTKKTEGNLGYLAAELQDLVLKNLRKLKKQNEDSVAKYSECVEGMSEQILQHLRLNKLPKELVVGPNQAYLWEGMSKRKVIPNTTDARHTATGEVYFKHRQLYVCDTALLFYKERALTTKKYLDEPAQRDTLKKEITMMLKKLPQQELDYYQEGESGYNDFVNLVGQQVEHQINFHTAIKLAAHPTSFLLGEQFSNTALAYSGTPASALNFQSIAESYEEPSYISPAVRARALTEIILAHKRQLYMMDLQTATDLPVGLVKEVGNKEVILAIDSMTFTPAGAFLSAFISMEIPFASDVQLPLGLQKVAFSPMGISSIASARLQLLKDVLVPISKDVQLVLKSGQSHAEIDCGGFKTLSLSGEFEFCENLMIPDGVNGKTGEITVNDQVTEGRVKARFTTTLQHWDEFIAEVDVDPFQLTSLPGWGFVVKDAIIDLSNTSNGGAITFPDDYISPAFDGNNKNGWKGFYLREASVKLPPKFKKKTSAAPSTDETPDDNAVEQRLTFEVRDLLIDNLGFTGKIAGKNIVPLREGDMGGWDFSIETVSVSIQTNAFKSATIQGQLDVPVLSPSNGNTAIGDLSYAAVIAPGDQYIFTIKALDSLNIPMWRVANLQLYPTSTFEMAIHNNTFRPKAVLNGALSIGAGLSDSPSQQNGAKFTVAEIGFQELTFQTVSPYVSASGFSVGLANRNSLGKFPISIEKIGLRPMPNNNQIGLGFDVVVNLVDENAGGFGGSCDVTVVGQRDATSGWHYKTTQVNKIAVDIDGVAYKLKGEIGFFKNDAVYGNGFKGLVNAEFAPGMTLGVTALFGEVNGMRYWNADGMVGFPTGVPFTTGFAFYGFGGGAYYHMRTVGHNEKAGSGIGTTPSGLVYVPDVNTALGIRAMVMLGTHPNKAPMNGDVTLDIAFNARGGVNTLSLSGNAYIMTPPLSNELNAVAGHVKLLGQTAGGNASGPATASPPIPMRSNAGIYGNFKLGYDFQSRVLHGNFNMYVNIAGVIKGRNANNLAGQVVLHSDFPNREFYIHAGTPSQRNGIKVAELFDLNSYMMTGTSVPDMPPPPSHIARILGDDFYSTRDTRTLSNGGGFVLGADFSFDTGDLSFLIFYGRFLMGEGFDIMLKDYGPDARCEGRTGSVGINGFYAAGQAYAYVNGKIGLEVDCAPIFSGRYTILDIGAAAILQAQLPNPYWMKGTVGGYYSVLNGLVKGTCKFEIELGDKCTIVTPNGGLQGLKVISQVTPLSQEENVNVFTAPQAIFNMPVNEEMSFVDLDGVEKRIRIKLEDFKVKHGDHDLVGTLRWNDDNTVLAFDSYDILPGQTALKAIVRLSFEENIRGGWQPIKQNNQLAIEQMETSFTTGAEPDHIPHGNVAFSYPTLNQLYFHKDEHPEAYIELKQGQPALFAPNAEWTQMIRFKKANGNAITANFVYSGKRVSFPLPQGLENSTIYTWEIVNIPTQDNTAVDANVYASAESVNLGQGSDVTVTTQQAEGSLEQTQEKAIFTGYFRTSSFGTFSAKMNSLTYANHWKWPIRAGVMELGLNLNGKELFDATELPQADNKPTLIQITADLEHTTWYNEIVHPLLYGQYAQHGFTIDWRAAEPWKTGIPPNKAVYMRQAYAPTLTTLDVENNQINHDLITFASPVYMLSYFVMNDYEELLQKAANHALRQSDPWIRSLLSRQGPYLSFPADYPVKLRYILPGTNIITFERTIILKRE